MCWFGLKSRLSMFEVVEGDLPVRAVLEASEAFCCDTGATVTPVGAAHYKPGHDAQDTETVAVKTRVAAAKRENEGRENEGSVRARRACPCACPCEPFVSSTSSGAAV